MALSDALSGAVAVLRRRPADLLPWYLLGAAVPAIVRVVPFLAAVVGFAYLETTGRLEAIVEVIGDVETEPPDPEADPEAFEEWVAEFEPALEYLVTPELVALAAATVVVSILLGLLCYAVVAAGQLTACAARVRDERGLTAGIAGVRRYWLRFLGLYVLEFLLWIAAVLLFGIGAALVAGFVGAATGSGPIAVLVGFAAVSLVVLALAAVRALFAFAPVAVVVDDATAVGSLWNALAFLRARPIEAIFYYAIAVGTLVALTTVSGVLVLVEVAAFPSLVTVLFVFPFLDLLKTGLYSDYRNRLTPPASPDRSLRGQVRAGVRRGWTELTTFVRATPGIHAFVVLLAVGSVWVGWVASEPFVGPVETSIANRLEGHVPPAAALEFFGNNWLVALTTAVSGVALAVPAIVSLLFNGLLMGIYARTEAELVELLAFVLPHGVFEIPAILVATALGVWLGGVGWRTYRGRAARADLADALERAFWVLIGIGVLLAVAALIEGFVSPYYFRPFL